MRSEPELCRLQWIIFDLFIIKLHLLLLLDLVYCDVDLLSELILILLGPHLP